MEKREKTNDIMQGALLLTVAGIVGKILSATYRIPLQNLTGDMGYYIYQQVYPLIGIGMILALYGFPQAVSKLTAERKKLGLSNTIQQFYLPVVLILFGLNIIFAIILYSIAPVLANWADDLKLVNTYKMAAGLFLVIPFLSALRGFYQGNGRMLPTAVSQVVEQIVRVIIIIVSAYCIYISRFDVYTIGQAGVLATITGMILAILGWGFFLNRKEKTVIQEKVSDIPWGYYIRTCFSVGIIAAMGHFILLLLQVIDMLTIVPGLVSAGVNEQVAMESKGIFDRGQPLIQFGAVIGSSFALALVPSVVHGTKDNAQTIREGLQFGFYLAGAAALGLILLMPEVNRLLFKTADGTMSLRILMLAVVLTALLITVASILQNMGYVYLVACCIILAVAVKWLFNWMFIPPFHLIGSAMGTVISLCFLLGTLLLLLHRKVQGLNWFSRKHIVSFTVASSMMTGFVLLLQGIVPTESLSRTGLLLFVMGVAMSGAIIYLVILIKLKVFSNQQLKSLPFGYKLIAVSEWMNQEKRG